MQDFYVDDMLTREERLEKPQLAINELIELIKRGGLKLLKWSSNHQDLLKDNQDNANHECVKLDPDDATKTLGVSWNSKKDMLLFEVYSVETQECLTKKRCYPKYHHCMTH